MISNEWAYRPDIDGLRAIAIALVLVFHGASDRLPGGYIGVDVFFIISGFLITGIIMKPHAEGNFSLPAFYAARVRRLYPALLVVLAATLLGGLLIATTADFQEIGRETTASALFVANLYFWFTTDYFHQDGIFPLLHLWSLGVEEQFYFVWPIILLLSTRLNRPVWLFAWAILLAALTYNYYLAAALPIAGFYSPAGRAWELMAGAVLALTAWRLPSNKWFEIASPIAILALIATALAPDQFTIFRLPTFIPVIATAVIICSPSCWTNRALLSSGPATMVGKISYPLYLWHWPILALLTIQQFGSAAPLFRIGGLLLSVILAFLTHKFIEVPRIKKSVWALLLAMAVTGALGFIVSRDGMPSRPVNADPRRAFVEGYRIRQNEPAQMTLDTRCDYYDFADHFAKTSLPADCTATHGRPAVIIWGDSHARALSSGIRRIIPSDHVTLSLATSGCAPSIENETVGRSALAVACRRSNKFVAETVGRLRPVTLILAQMQQPQDVDWIGFAAWARRVGVRNVVLIGAPPQWYPTLPAVVARYHWADQNAFIVEGVHVPTVRGDEVLRRRLGPKVGVEFVSLIGSLCHDGACLARVPGQSRTTLMVGDYGHLTPQGSAFVARTIIAPKLLPGLSASDSLAGHIHRPRR